MCYQFLFESQELRMTFLNRHHLEKIQGRTDPETAIFAEKTFTAWTKSLSPHLVILPMFVAMFEALKNQDYGVLGKYRLIRVPLSVIGEDEACYRLPIMSLLNEAILSANMSDIAKDYFKQSLIEKGLMILFTSSASVVLGKRCNINQFYGSFDHLDMDKSRSRIDFLGQNYHQVASWDNMPILNRDIHANRAEQRMFDRITELTAIAYWHQKNEEDSFR